MLNSSQPMGNNNLYLCTSQKQRIPSHMDFFTSNWTLVTITNIIMSITQASHQNLIDNWFELTWFMKNNLQYNYMTNVVMNNFTWFAFRCDHWGGHTWSTVTLGVITEVDIHDQLWLSVWSLRWTCMINCNFRSDHWGGHTWSNMILGVITEVDIHDQLWL